MTINIMHVQQKWRIPVLLAITLLFISSCATSPTGRSQLMLTSPESAIAMSKEAYVKALKPLDEKGKIDNNPALARRIRQITGRLITEAITMYPHTKNWEWSIRVIDDPKTVNAWCMAGGKMAIYTGIIEKTKATDDEIAQIMGHEISHALANHTAEKMSMAMAAQGGGLLLGIGTAVLLGDERHLGEYMLASSALASVGVTLPNSREAEREADAMGIELAAKAGYNPHAAAALWRKMSKIGGSPPQFLSTHPSSKNRAKTLQILAEKVMPYYLEKKEHPVYKFAPEKSAK